MKHLTTLMHCSAVILLLAIVSAQHTSAQDTLYVERNGIGEAVNTAGGCIWSDANPDPHETPCSLSDALAAVSGTVNKISVLVRNSGGTVRFRGDQDFNGEVEFYAWVEDGERRVKGMIGVGSGFRRR